MARLVIDDLKPGVAMPMHCKTAKCNWPLNTIEDFMAGKKNIKKMNSSEIEFSAGTLSQPTEIVILAPAS